MPDGLPHARFPIIHALVSRWLYDEEDDLHWCTLLASRFLLKKLDAPRARSPVYSK
jgi:hypothetical protein